jgi:fused signal recognition particle receptor
LVGHDPAVPQLIAHRVPLTGLIVTKFDGTSKGGMVVAIQKELGLPIKFIGLGEQPDDLQPFDAKQFAESLVEE